MCHFGPQTINHILISSLWHIEMVFFYNACTYILGFMGQPFGDPVRICLTDIKELTYLVHVCSNIFHNNNQVYLLWQPKRLKSTIITLQLVKQRSNVY